MGAEASAIVIGVGAARGIGAAVCRRFAAGGLHVFAAGRTGAKVDKVAADIRARGGSADAVTMDATDEGQVVALFDRAAARGPVAAMVFNAGSNRRADFRDLTVAQFEELWRAGCFAGFLAGREAARRLVPQGFGTVIFTGASASLRGRPGFAAFAAAKAGLRMVAQSMARECGPQGVHVAHVVIDGGVDGERLRTGAPQRVAAAGPDGLLDPEAIAETYWQIHAQPRSAWAHEVDLRPFREPF